MILKKIIRLSILMLTLAIPVTVIAEPIETVPLDYDMISEDGIEICSSDHIEYHYRIVDGVVQYRRWNATRGYWIDATWLNL